MKWGRFKELVDSQVTDEETISWIEYYGADDVLILFNQGYQGYTVEDLNPSNPERWVSENQVKHPIKGQGGDSH